MKLTHGAMSLHRAGVALAAGAGFLSMGAVGEVGAGAPPDRPNVIVLLVDTARADHFSTYGYDRETTPHFGALADDGILFEHAYSTSCWTVPAHASLFTGLYPMTHGATQERRTVDDELTTVAEILRENGYETAAYSGNPWVSNKTNMMQGFDRATVIWDKAGRKTVGLHPANRKIVQWLDERDPERPFFLFVNYIEPHWPYQAPSEFQDRFLPDGVEVAKGHPAHFAITRWYLKRSLVSDEAVSLRTATYDAELAYVDTILDELVGELANRSLLDPSLLIVTSDHGENHGDHGHMGHSFSLHDSVVRIPLLVKPPSWRDGSRTRTDPVQILDLFPTILNAAGVGVPESTGNDALDLLDGPGPEDRPVIAEYYYPDQVLGFFPEGAEEHEAMLPYLRRIRSIRVGTDKFVWGSDGRHELYDLARDAAETDNLIERDADTARDLQKRLDEFVALRSRETLAVDTDGLDEETREQLRSLGYLR